MKYKTVFHFVSAVSKKENISLCLIGGFAVNYYKVSRQTADVDFLITKEDYNKIVGLLRKEGFKQDYAQEAFARLTSDMEYLMDVDFLFVDNDTLDKIIQTGKKIDIAGQEFVVPSLRHLIALKLHAIKCNPKARELKDFLDITEMVKANKVNVRDSDFKELCIKYATEELYQKIVDWVG